MPLIKALSVLNGVLALQFSRDYPLVTPDKPHDFKISIFLAISNRLI